MSFLKIERLTKTYDQIVAVGGISLDIERGEFVSLLGPSGCGKTTTLQMIAGFVEVTSGRIVLDGRDLAEVPPAKRGLGMVFQSYALFPHMTVAQNVGFGLEMRKVGRADRDRKVAAALQLVGLSTMADRYPRRMSGGQQQRVALARALVIEPNLLLLDEPMSNLDAKLRDEMQGELRDIQERTGLTTILVTHDQSEAMALSDRVVVMNRGVIEQVGPPEAGLPDARLALRGWLPRSNRHAGRRAQRPDRGGARPALDPGGRGRCGPDRGRRAPRARLLRRGRPPGRRAQARLPREASGSSTSKARRGRSSFWLPTGAGRCRRQAKPWASSGRPRTCASSRATRRAR